MTYRHCLLMKLKNYLKHLFKLKGGISMTTIDYDLIDYVHVKNYI